MEDIIKKADVLIEALPYIKAFHKKITVIKYGGSILGDNRIRQGVLEDVVFLSYMGLKPILVHGGGPNITERMKKSGKATEFIEGMRVTDAETLKVVEEELRKLNRQIVEEIKMLGARATGLSGKDRIIQVRKKKGKRDLGLVGEIVKINTSAIDEELNAEAIPIISPMGRGLDKKVYNVNADEVAAAIAISLKAEKLVLLTNVKGIMRNPEDVSSLMSTLNTEEAKRLIKEKVIQEGMIPKVKSCIDVLEGGVKKTHIIDARLPHALLLEIFTDRGIGTEIIR